MKGFIEVTNNRGDVFLININNIKHVWSNCIINNDESNYICKQSYSQIKELIKQAQ